MALLDAFALSRALASEGADVASGLENYVDLRLRHIRLYQALTRAFTPVYQSDSRIVPILRDALLGPLSRIPPAPWLLARLVAGLVGDPLRALGLDETG